MSQEEIPIRPYSDLVALLNRSRGALLASWREQVRELPSARHLDTPTLNDHMPGLLDELVNALETDSDQTIPERLGSGSPPAHGTQRVQDRFDIEEVVSEYNILRGCIHDLADANGLTLQGKPFHVLNLVFDSAIGIALQTYATRSALDVLQRREEYLAFVAHDLRTPLNAISLAGRVLELTLGRQNLEGNEARMLKALRRNVEHIETLVAKVLEENTNLKTETGLKIERRHFDLWPLVESLIHDLHPVAGTASTTITNEVPEDLAVFADASLLRRIFQNLIANAIKYTPRGEIRIGARSGPGNIGVECWVTDNGTGISDDLIERIFEKGESGPDGEGAGLGLAIVKTFTEAHGGKVLVESAAGAGSTFRISLPDDPKATKSHREPSP